MTTRAPGAARPARVPETRLHDEVPGVEAGMILAAHQDLLLHPTAVPLGHCANKAAQVGGVRTPDSFLSQRVAHPLCGRAF